MQPLFPLYNGNPSSALMPQEGIFSSNSWLSFKSGYEYDAVFSSSMKNQSQFPKSKVEKFTSHSQFCLLTLNCADRVEIFSGLGTMATSFTQRFEDAHLHFHNASHFAYSIGGRVLFAYWGNLQFGLSAAYLHFFHNMKGFVFNLIPVKADLHYRQWQIGAALSYKIYWLFPYLGVKYSDVQAKYVHVPMYADEDFTLKNTQPLGIVIGCGIAPQRAFSLNIEGRFLGEDALTVNANIKF